MESPAYSDDLFNLELICTATVDVVLYSCEGREEGLVDRLIVGEWDGCSCPSEWFGLNRGTSTYGCKYWWRDVLLVRVVEFAGSGLVWVWEADAGNVGGAVFADSEESCVLLLDGSVFLLRAY